MALSIGIVGAATGFALWNVTQGSRQPPSSTLLLLPEPRAIEAFDLTDHRGRPFTLDNLRGRWSLIFFGFTNCPDVCPGALYDLDLVSDQLDELKAGGKAGHQVVFVSVDPERDSAEKLSQYLGHFNPGFVGATGSEDQLMQLTRQLGIPYQVEAHEPGAAKYAVYHSASILLTDTQGRLCGAFPAPHDAGKMIENLADLF
jgi:protein SCO1/2